MTLRSRLRPSVALTGLLAVAALGLAGCASGDAGTGSADGTSGTPAAATSLSDVKAKGELVIGTEGTYSPFSFHEGSGSGALTGYDVEVATAVADKLGVKPVFEETQFDGIFAGPRPGAGTSSPTRSPSRTSARRSTTSPSRTRSRPA